MKAPAWQRWISIAIGTLVLAAMVQPALAESTPGKHDSASRVVMPVGWPGLPALGEAMQRNMSSGLALNGFDPVAYQAQGQAVAGRAEYELTHRGASWRFVSEANREAFRDAPDVYEPAFAGFDPTGVANGRAVETNPAVFAVVDSRLFLFRTQANRDGFLADRSLLKMAQAGWGEVNREIAN